MGRRRNSGHRGLGGFERGLGFLVRVLVELVTEGYAPEPKAEPGLEDLLLRDWACVSVASGRNRENGRKRCPFLLESDSERRSGYPRETRRLIVLAAWLGPRQPRNSCSLFSSTLVARTNSSRSSRRSGWSSTAVARSKNETKFDGSSTKQTIPP